MRKLESFVLLYLISIFVYATPQLPDTCGVSAPSFLLKTIITEAEINVFLNSCDWGQTTKTEKYWTVYSDRSHNFAYSQPSIQGEICDTLSFNEQVRIAQIENDYALVYTENQKGVTFPLISTSAQSRGWIPMKNLLLWNSCPMTENGIYEKAFIAYPSDDHSFGEKGMLYKNPVTQEDSHKLLPDMCFYFVVKKSDNGSVLLARDCKMEGHSDQVLYGWINENFYIPWNERVCLEPNWKLFVTDPLKGKTACVYQMDEKDVASIVLCQLNPQSGNNITRYRWNAHRMRFPLLEDSLDNKERFHILAFCSPQELGVPYLMIGDSSAMFEFEGYVDKQLEGVNLWNPVLCISADEFGLILEKLQPVMSAANIGTRKSYVEAMKMLVQSMFPDITSEELNNQDVKKVIAYVEGLNLKTNAIPQGRTLEQILNNKIMDDDEFDVMISDFRNKYNKLKIIRENNYEFSIERNKTRWYWLPVEDLP